MEFTEELPPLASPKAKQPLKIKNSFKEVVAPP